MHARTLDRDGNGMPLVAEARFAPLAQGPPYFWVILAWLVALTTALTVGDVFEGAVFMVLVGFTQMIFMAVSSSLIMRFRFRNRPAFRSGVLGGISYLAGCFTLWNAGWFSACLIP